LAALNAISKKENSGGYLTLLEMTASINRTLLDTPFNYPRSIISLATLA
jgi:hypothetical protein